MTDIQLRKLSRVQLLEMLLAQTKEVEKLRGELQEARQKLEDRRICLADAGNIAEAALRMNGVFEAAQAAAEEYLANVSDSVQASQEHCRILEEQTRRRCEQMVCSAQAEAGLYWDAVREKIRDPYLEWESWHEIMSFLDSKPGDQSKVRK